MKKRYIEMRLKIILVFLFTPLSVDAQPIIEGSGSFIIPGGEGRIDKTVSIYFHVPQNWKEDSPVVLVIPGAGRNAWSYRNAWVTESEKKGFIVVSPSYSDEFYPRFWNYNIARMIGDVEINKAKTNFENFSISSNSNEWIFNDFDRIFDDIKSKLTLTTETYDVFGHSAGGQILHRFALFYDSKKVDKILSSNSGWYTVPNFETKFPTGLIDAPINRENLKHAFSKKLILFLGELDNENETRGHLLKNPRMNKQGLHRLERGHYFYVKAKEQAAALSADFRWEKVVISGVGHDYKKMSIAASHYLYGQ